MSTTIQQSLRPFFFMCFIMGLGVYPIKQLKTKFRWITHLNILYFFTIWFVYGYILFYAVTIFSPIVLFKTTIFMVIFTMVNVTAISSAILNFYHHKKLQIYMNRLAAVDDTLEKIGTPKTYRKLHMLSIKVIIAWIVHAVIKNIYDTILSFNVIKQFSKQVSWGIIAINIIYHPIHINAFTDLMFIFLLWYIGTRFDKINDHMHCLLLKKERGLKYMGRKSVYSYRYLLHRHNYKWTLWTSMHLHLELCRITRELNMIFRIQIVFGMALNFGWLTAYCYYLCRALEQTYQDQISLQDIVTFVFWILICFIRLYAVNHICESVKIKANNIHKITLQLINSLRYADMWNEVYFFVLHVMQYPLKITGLGLFCLGHQFLLQVVSTIVTFVIIMIQLNLLVPFY